MLVIFVGRTQGKGGDLLASSPVVISSQKQNNGQGKVSFKRL
jgi:hypothetical protein